MTHCEHKQFSAIVEVNLLTKGDDGPVHGYLAEIRITCVECGQPFEFVGVEAGLMMDKPMASVDAQQLRAPIRPKGSRIMPAIPGFRVMAN